MLPILRTTTLADQCCHHRHDYHQLVLGLSGRAEFELAGQSDGVDSHQGCLVPAEIEHYFEGRGDNSHLILDLPVAALDLRTQGDWVERLFERPAFFVADRQLRLLTTFIVHEVSVGEGGSATPAPLLAETLLAALTARLIGASRPEDRFLAQIDDYIERHLGERIEVADLAREACMSVSHFHSTFRCRTGKSPYQYLLEKRLRRVRDLLSSAISLTDIAGCTGFSSQSAMTNAFRKQFGHPPGQLRRNLQKVVCQRPALA